MKVLFLAPHIFTNVNDRFKKRDSGFGRIVFQIANELSKRNEVSVLTYINTKETELSKLKLIEQNVIASIMKFKLSNIIENLKIVNSQSKYSIKQKIYLLVKLLMEESIVEKINEKDYDVIHIHGMTLEVLPFLKAAIKSRVPFVVTLHGLNYNNIEALEKGNRIREFEIGVIKYLLTNNIKVSVLTEQTGKIVEEEFLNNIKTPSLKIIPNGIDKEFNDLTKIQLNDKLKGVLNNLKDKKIVVSVGSLGIRKNQIFLLKSLKYISQDILERLHILICGEGPKENELKKYVNDNNLSEQVTFLGNVDNKQLRFIYKQSELLSMTSLTEGFGVPVLEALMFENRIISIADLEFVNQIKNYSFCSTIEERNEKEYAKLIEKTLFKTNDENLKKEINKFVKDYYWEKISEKYEELYRNNYILESLTLDTLKKVINKIYKIK